MSFTGIHVPWLAAWATIVALIYQFFGTTWFTIPWLPLSIMATAVAFYVGFKNNQAYDRLWEARKIWGGIVNASRAWGSAVIGYVSNLHTEQAVEEDSIQGIHKSMVLRHIAWLYIHRGQLLQSETWEHINQNKHIARITKQRRDTHGIGLLDDNIVKDKLMELLDDEDIELAKGSKNAATQILHKQSTALKELRQKGLIDDFRHMELQRIVKEFYELQGKNERIKKFPFPRQYGGMSSVFVGIFIFLAPFGLVSEFASQGEYGVWVSIPFTVLVTWVFLVMELVGDYSENPFEGLGNDIPMLALCRTIEIDLKQMLGYKDLPSPIEAKNNVLL